LKVIFPDIDIHSKKSLSNLPKKYYKLLYSALNKCKIKNNSNGAMENFSENSINKQKSDSSLGKILAGISGLSAVGISILCFPFISPGFRKIALPFLPATDNQIKNILSVLPKNPAIKKKLIDIGSGDGRIVISAANV
jgi:hypothetical protein